MAIWKKTSVWKQQKSILLKIKLVWWHVVATVQWVLPIPETSEAWEYLQHSRSIVPYLIKICKASSWEERETAAGWMEEQSQTDKLFDWIWEHTVPAFPALTIGLEAIMEIAASSSPEDVLHTLEQIGAMLVQRFRGIQKTSCSSSSTWAIFGDNCWSMQRMASQNIFEISKHVA